MDWTQWKSPINFVRSLSSGRECCKFVLGSNQSPWIALERAGARWRRDVGRGAVAGPSVPRWLTPFAFMNTNQLDTCLGPGRNACTAFFDRLPAARASGRLDKGYDRVGNPQSIVIALCNKVDHSGGLWIYPFMDGLQDSLRWAWRWGESYYSDVIIDAIKGRYFNRWSLLCDRAMDLDEDRTDPVQPKNVFNELSEFNTVASEVTASVRLFFAKFSVAHWWPQNLYSFALHTDVKPFGWAYCKIQRRWGRVIQSIASLAVNTVYRANNIKLYRRLAIYFHWVTNYEELKNTASCFSVHPSHYHGIVLSKNMTKSCEHGRGFMTGALCFYENSTCKNVTLKLWDALHSTFQSTHPREFRGTTTLASNRPMLK